MSTLPHADQSSDSTTVGLLAEFNTPGALITGARKLRDAGYRRFDAHSPFPVHGIDEAIGIKPTILPWLVMIAGIAGCATGIVLQWWTNAVEATDYSFVPTFVQGYAYRISGKPMWSFPANVPVIFELTILFSALTAVFGMFILNDLPTFYRPVFNLDRFRKVTDDGFFLAVDARDARFNESTTSALLEEISGQSVDHITDTPSGFLPPQWMINLSIVAAVAGLIPLGLIWKAWNTYTDKPRIHIIQDMDNQIKYKAQKASAIFADGRTMRPLLSGTIARGDLREDDHYSRGRVGNEWAINLPLHRLTVDEAFMKRGQEQFNINCSACHGRDAAGGGAVAVRAAELPGGAWVAPANLNGEEYRLRTVGHLFNTIASGIRTMPAYGDRMNEDDIWAVVAYVRAIQRSRYAPLSDVPADMRVELEKR